MWKLVILKTILPKKLSLYLKQLGALMQHLRTWWTPKQELSCKPMLQLGTSILCCPKTSLQLLICATSWLHLQIMLLLKTQELQILRGFQNWVRRKTISKRNQTLDRLLSKVVATQAAKQEHHLPSRLHCWPLMVKLQQRAHWSSQILISQVASGPVPLTTRAQPLRQQPRWGDRT